MYANGSPPPAKTGGSTTRSKRKRHTWGARERAGMSFLIVVAFFAVFGLIILTEVLMIDERGRGGGVLIRSAGYNSRMAESAPDYEESKDDLSLDEAIILREAKIAKLNGAKGGKHRNELNRINSNGIPAMPDPIDPRTNGMHIPYGSLLPPSIERTLSRLSPDMKPTDGSWQIVNGTRFKFFVFSAYYDRRDGKMIRVVGATKTRAPEKVWCRFWYPLGQNRTKFRSASVMARVKTIRENWNLKYSACFVLCPLRAPGLDVPYAVSIVSKLRAAPGNVLLVRNTDSDPDFGNRSVSQIPNSVAICVKPLHFNYDQALYLLEYLELNSILGVSHFTFYNHTLGPRASCVLKHYMDGGSTSPNTSTTTTGAQLNFTPDPIVDNLSSHNQKITVSVLPWDLRMRSQKEIRTEGLFAALNDCVYRSMYRYQYVALVDLDEFIIPRHNDTLTDLLTWLSLRINSRNTGAYSFQNAFFYLQFADDVLMYKTTSQNAALRGALVTQRKSRRRLKLHPQKQRSKYICKPEAVVEAGNHFVWEFLPGKGSLNVPADAAILHHYRVCEFGGDDCIKTPSLTDRTAHKYTKQLMDRVELVYNQLKVPCNLEELPPPPTAPPPTRGPFTHAKITKSLKSNEVKVDKMQEVSKMKVPIKVGYN